MDKGSDWGCVSATGERCSDGPVDERDTIYVHLYYSNVRVKVPGVSGKVRDDVRSVILAFKVCKCFIEQNQYVLEKVHGVSMV